MENQKKHGFIINDNKRRLNKKCGIVRCEKKK